MSDGIDLIIEGSVAHVVLDQQDRRNAFSSAMLVAYEDAIGVLERDRSVEVAVLRAEGPSFCAGTDLKELETFDADDTLHFQNRTGRVVERWARLEATTVTAYNGPAIGSGAIIGLASDLRIAAEGTVFFFPEVSFGIPLTWSGIPILTEILGADRARRMLLLSETIEIDELVQLGLVMKSVPVDELQAETESLVGRILESPQIGRLMTKRAILAAASAPGFLTGAYEPFLASLSIHARGEPGFSVGSKKKKLD
jgi:enoyl-CoA hydratase/carnithine racemase